MILNSLSTLISEGWVSQVILARGAILSWDGLTGNRYVLLAILVLIGLQLLFTYQPTLQALFHTAALDWAAWGRILAFGLGVLLVVELEKALVRHLGRRNPRRRGSGGP
jgi:magnesium-transporting ATPase (P-type)